jgi:hypothetical protein
MRGKAGRFAGRVFFSPANFAGLTGWWDASDPSTLFDATSGGSLVAADGTVARLEDKSGQGRHFTQSTSGNRPARKTSQQNGRDVLRFDGSDTWMLGPIFEDLFNSPPATSFIVAKATSIATSSFEGRENAAVLSEEIGFHGFFSLAGFSVGGGSDSTLIDFGQQSIFKIGNWLSYTPGNWACLATLHASGNLVSTLNKSTSTTSSLSFRSNTNNATVLGASYDKTVVLNGDVGEIITYNVALSTADIEAVEDYLIDKWGIS